MLRINIRNAYYVTLYSVYYVKVKLLCKRYVMYYINIMLRIMLMLC